MTALSLLDMAAILFSMAALLGLLNHHLFKLPFTIGMTFSAMLASFAVIGLDKLVPTWHLADSVRAAVSGIDFTYALLNGMLGFLLFAGALHTDLDKLRKFAAPVGALAVLGTVIATSLMGFGSYYLFDAIGIHVPLIFCLIFGALIAPTDPVAVLGIMRAAGAPKNLEVKVIGESLFNDGIGVVIFAVLVGIATASMGEVGGHGAEAMSAGGVMGLIAKEVVGGVALGIIAGYGAYKALCSIDEANLEILITLALVMFINLIAFKVHTSSPLACVIAGLFIGNRGRTLAMSSKTRENLDIVWSFIDEALNAILFLLIGLEIITFTFKGTILTASLLMIPLGLLARFIAVAVPVNMLKAIRMSFIKGSVRVLTWGGLKGGISIALAMSLPDFEGRDAVLAATYAIVLFSILVQGLTVGKLIQHVVPKSEEPVSASH